MKKFLIISVLLFLNCTWIFLPEENQITIDDCAVWCAKNIKNMPDKNVWEIDDYWQTPNQTREKKSGDCEDVCGLFLDMCDKRGYQKLYLYCVEIPNISYHMVASVENKVYDVAGMWSQNSGQVYDSINEYPYKWIYRISFADYKELSENYHEYRPGYGKINK